jgi:hypothetical protein
MSEETANLSESKCERLLDELLDDPDLQEGRDMGPPSDCPDLRGKSDDEATDLMVQWFRENFEDPSESTPRDSGEWVWIWGGPFDADEEIHGAFDDQASDGHASDEAIAAAIKEVGGLWARVGAGQQPHEA